MSNRKIRKHQGIIQTGGNSGQLKKGYRYSEKKLKSGLPQIVKSKTQKTQKTQKGGNLIYRVIPLSQKQKFINEQELDLVIYGKRTTVSNSKMLETILKHYPKFNYKNLDKEFHFGSPFTDTDAMKAEQEIEEGKWRCPSCTYINNNSRDECEICGLKKPSENIEIDKSKDKWRFTILLINPKTNRLLFTGIFGSTENSQNIDTSDLSKISTIEFGSIATRKDLKGLCQKVFMRVISEFEKMMPKLTRWECTITPNEKFTIGACICYARAFLEKNYKVKIRSSDGKEILDKTKISLRLKTAKDFCILNKEKISGARLIAIMNKKKQQLRKSAYPKLNIVNIRFDPSSDPKRKN